MEDPNQQFLEIKTETDLLKARQLARSFAKNLGFNIVNQTKVITAVSELVRNVILYAEQGFLVIKSIKEEQKVGIFVKIVDQGPGIADTELVLKDGYSTGGGLGKGLSGTKRLMDLFKISSKIGKGTEVEIIKWKS